MAHCTKMTKGAVGHMFKHYERAKDENGEYVKFGNENIDTNRSYFNYNLALERESQGEFVKQRCSEVKCLKRKDVNVMCSWIVTVPKDLKQEEHERFFKLSYDFLEKRYGKENVVSSYVHMDEVSPHMHFTFVPVTYDKKKEQYKVSAKEVVNRTDLQTFHKDLSAHMECAFGRDIGILNEATKEGNKSIEELKKGTAMDTLNTVLSDTRKIKIDIKLLENDKKALEGQIQSLEGKILTLQEVNQVKIKKPLLGSQKTIIKMPYQDIINLQRTAQRVGQVDDKLKLIDQKTKEIKDAYQSLLEKQDELKRIPLERQMEKIKLLKENKELKQQIDTVNEIMEKRLDLFVELKKEAKEMTQKVVSKGFSPER